MGEGGVPDPVWADVVELFGDQDTVHLLLAVAVINVWNRLAVTNHQALPRV